MSTNARQRGMMRIQKVEYTIFPNPVDFPGLGYTDRARFIFYVGSTAFLFGDHDGRTLIFHFFTSIYLLWFELEQTAKPPKPWEGIDLGYCSPEHANEVARENGEPVRFRWQYPNESKPWTRVAMYFPGSGGEAE